MNGLFFIFINRIIIVAVIGNHSLLVARGDCESRRSETCRKNLELSFRRRKIVVVCYLLLQSRYRFVVFFKL